MVSWQNRSGRRSNVSYAELEDWRAQSRTLRRPRRLQRRAPMNISDDRALPEQAHGNLAHGQRVRRAPAAAAARPRLHSPTTSGRAPTRS